ncbi:hypothetical protein [Thermus scotoductus]|uniref:COG1470 family protein n=1 Tax=Thermus scotoductus TaxID=37636 RepID=UPI000F807E76|nr:hypothetical protein [Thermus scotoductus]
MLFLLPLLLLGACTSVQGSLTGKLSVQIDGLPSGVEARVVVQPLGKAVSASQVLEVPEGTYEVVAEAVEGPSGERYVPTVEGSPARVEYGKVVQVRVSYQVDRDTLPATLILVIEGLPEGAEGSLRVSGEGVNQVVKSTGRLTLRPGVYTLRADAVSYAGERYIPSPASDYVVLAPGSTVSKTFTYAREVRTGELLIIIQGLPTGTQAQVRVKDSAGSTVASLTESRLLRLPAGTYFVEADPVGTYVPQVSGSPANVQAGARAEVQVSYQNQPQSLSLTLNPTALTVPPGSTGTLQATLQAQNFSGQVSLALQGAPSGVTIAPTSASAPGQVDLTLSVASSVAPGTYPITLQATGQGVSASASFTLSVPRPDFAFSLSPQSLSLAQGQSTTLVASITPQSGFSGQIAFSLVSPPAGFSLSGGPVSPSGPVDVPLTLSVASSVAPGTYSLLVKAEGGGVVRTVSLQVQVQASTGQLAVVISGLPDGLEGNVEIRNSQAGLVSVLGKSQVLALPPDTYFISARDVRDGQGNTYRGSVNGSPAMVQAGQRVQVSVSYTLLPRPGFTLSASPSTLNIPKGRMGNTTLTITPQNGFSGMVELSLEGAPEGVRLSPTSVAVEGVTTVPLTLSVAGSVSPGSYSLSLVGKSGAVVGSTNLLLEVPAPSFDFAISPASFAVRQGQRQTLVASLRSQGGFAGEVAFSLVSPPPGFTLSGGPFTLSEDQAVDFPLFLQVDASVAPGSYSLVVKAEGGGVSRTQTLSVQVSPSTGQLALSILFEGAPAGTEGYVVVSGPGGDQVITRSRVLTLAPGTYTITAYSVVVGETQYNPEPPGGTVQVLAGQTASFTITYKPPTGP